VVLSTADPNSTIGDTGALADIVFIKPVSYAQLHHIARRLRPADPQI
jgi:hypothetical protein